MTGTDHNLLITRAAGLPLAGNEGRFREYVAHVIVASRAALKLVPLPEQVFSEEGEKLRSSANDRGKLTVPASARQRPRRIK